MNNAKNILTKFVFNWGLLDRLQSINRHCLTILNYHRIEPGDSQTWSDLFQPNISATPEQFAEQILYLKKIYNPISLDQLLNWLRGQETLPDFPTLITFDDGYRDNLIYAAPILRREACPAVIYLTSGYIGKPGNFYWDVSALCFARTPRQDADLPLLGKRIWSTMRTKTMVLREWVEILKQVDEATKQAAMSTLPGILEVTLSEGAFADTMMTWDEVRSLQSLGIACGAHSATHPILTRLPLQQAEREIIESKQKIEQELNQPVRAFAYPNGQAKDITPEIQSITAKAGFEAAFSLIAGPSKLKEVKQNPYAIRRIFIGNKDDLPRFATKLAGGLRYFHIRQKY